jgi:hypothetical protein
LHAERSDVARFIFPAKPLFLRELGNDAAWARDSILKRWGSVVRERRWGLLR